MNVALRPLTYISTCTGGGGLDAGLHLACGDHVVPCVYVERIQADLDGMDEDGRARHPERLFMVAAMGIC